MSHIFKSNINDIDEDSPWKQEGDGNYEDGRGGRVQRDTGDDHGDDDDEDDDADDDDADADDADANDDDEVEDNDGGR